MMPYISPIRFFEYCQISENEVTQETIPRLKKIIQLEFASSENGIISIDGFNYNHQDLLLLLNANNALEIISYHYSIWKEKDLLNILERNEWSENYTYKEGVYSSTFKEFISPFFASSFAKKMGQDLSNDNINDAITLLSFEKIMQPEDLEIAYKPVRIFLQDSLFFYRNLNKENYKKQLKRIEFWKKSNWPTFLNKLPSYFEIEIDELARKMINFTVEIQKVNKKLTYFISSKLCNLNLEADLKKLVLRNHKVYLGNSSFIELKGRNKKLVINKFKAIFFIIGLSIVTGFIVVSIQMYISKYKKLHADEITISTIKDNENNLENFLVSLNSSKFKTNPYLKNYDRIDSVVYENFDPLYLKIIDYSKPNSQIKIRNHTQYGFFIYNISSINHLEKGILNSNDSLNVKLPSSDFMLVVQNYKELAKNDDPNSDLLPKIYGLHPKIIFSNNKLTDSNDYKTSGTDNNQNRQLVFDIEYLKGSLKISVKDHSPLYIYYF